MLNPLTQFVKLSSKTNKKKTCHNYQICLKFIAFLIVTFSNLCFHLYINNITK